MSFEEQMILILLCGLASVITRFIPFLIFRPGQEIPEWIRYLGDVLPLAIFAMLMVYCVKDIDFGGSTLGIPEVVSIVFMIIVHVRWRNMLFSILAGMVCYFALYLGLPLII